MPIKIEFSKSDIKYIATQYGKGASLATLAETFEVTTPVIRRILVDAGVAIKGRGRPSL